MHPPIHPYSTSTTIKKKNATKKNVKHNKTYEFEETKYKTTTRKKKDGYSTNTITHADRVKEQKPANTI